MNDLINGNCIDVMANMDPESIDLTVTSPPYDQLRDYKGFTFDFEGVANQLFRVTKKGGVVVWVVGDSVIKGSESLTSFKQALYFKEIGFNVHDTMIYEKSSSSLPDPTRYFQSFEYMFVLSKGKPKAINKIYDVKNKYIGLQTNNVVREKDGLTHKRADRIIGDYSYRRNVWRFTVGYMHTTKDKYAYEHPAMFPEKLAEDHIYSWSNPGDIVLDPFCGSGTTCKMAKLLHRNYIGIDISEEYLKIARRRLAQNVI